MENFENSKVSIAEPVQIPTLQLEWMEPIPKQRANHENERLHEKSAEKEEKLEFDYVPQGRRLILASITMPDGGKITRTTEPLPGTDGRDGFRILKGYTLPNGELLPKEIHRNTDGSITLLDIDVENRNPDRHPQRMSQSEFIEFVRKFGK